MLVCECRSLSDRQIHRLVNEGARSARDVARATGAGMGCGGCRSKMKRVVAVAVEREIEKTRVDPPIMLDMSVRVEG